MNKTSPKGWIEIKLLELVLNKKGKKPKQFSNIRKDGFLPYIDIKAFEKGEITKYGEINSSSLINRNDILVVWDGARFGFVGKNQEGAAGSTIMIITPCIIDSIYTYYFLQHKYPYINSNPKGTGIPHVNPDIFWNMPFPLPPLAEQKRISTKLDAVLPRLEKLKERVNKSKELIKQFRQSVLNAAVTGKLLNFFIESKIVSLKTVSILITKGASPKWQGINYTDDSDQTLFVTSENVGRLELILDNPKYVEDKFNLRQKRSILKFGDVLTNIVGASIGRTCVYNRNIKANVNQAVCIIRLDEKYLTPDYLAIFLNSRIGIGRLTENIVNVARANVSLTSIKNIEIELPTIINQQKILKRVKELFSVADKLEARLEQLSQQIDDLGKSVLAKAFQGELVPTEAELAEKENRSYETAEELLKRIKAEKKKLEAEKEKK